MGKGFHETELFVEKAFDIVNSTLSLVILQGLGKSKIECQKHIWP